MNDEIAIAAAVATIRGPAQPRHHSLEARPAGASHRAHQPNQAGEAKRFHAPVERPNSNLRPGRSRPGISRVRRTNYSAVAQLGNNYWLWGGAVCLIGFAVLRAATQVGIAGPVVVHLVWPV